MCDYKLVIVIMGGMGLRSREGMCNEMCHASAPRRETGNIRLQSLSARKIIGLQLILTIAITSQTKVE